MTRPTSLFLVSTLAIAGGCICLDPTGTQSEEATARALAVAQLMAPLASETDENMPTYSCDGDSKWRVSPRTGGTFDALPATVWEEHDEPALDRCYSVSAACTVGDEGAKLVVAVATDSETGCQSDTPNESLVGMVSLIHGIASDGLYGDCGPCGVLPDRVYMTEYTETLPDGSEVGRIRTREFHSGDNWLIEDVYDAQYNVIGEDTYDWSCERGGDVQIDHDKNDEGSTTETCTGGTGEALLDEIVCTDSEGVSTTWKDWPWD